MKRFIRFVFYVGVTACFLGYEVQMYATVFEKMGTQLKTVPSELTGIFMYPVSHSAETLGYSSAILGLMAVDQPTTAFVQRTLNPMTNVHLFGTIGPSNACYIGLAGWYALSLFSQDEKAQDVTYLSVKAIGYSYLISHVILKSAFGRLRPDFNLDHPSESTTYTSNPWQFFKAHPVYLESDPYGTSFPSFHFTLFFSLARVWQRTYGDFWIPYSLCVAFLVPDFADHHHWVSDMVAGALIGTMIGDSIMDAKEAKAVDRNALEPKGFVPFIGMGTVGVRTTF